MRVLENFDLTNYNAYKIQAKCRKAYFPENEEDLLKLFDIKPKINIIGNGNNIILSKHYYEEDFLIFNNIFDTIHLNGNNISAGAGATLENLSLFAYKNGLTGLESFYDIPSSIGGAIVMNAGASGNEIKDILVKIRFLDIAHLSIEEIDSKEAYFEYRNSLFQKTKDKIIIKGWFQLQYGDKKDIFKTMQEIKSTRWAKQPREYPNCGSVFKRPRGKYVGPMLDELGFKGFRIGGAEVSAKHSGFIINRGNATGSEILELISIIKNRVKESYNIDIEVEQRII